MGGHGGTGNAVAWKAARWRDPGGGAGGGGDGEHS